MRAKISIVGLLLADNTVFDNMVVPSQLSRDLIVSNICNACYDLEVLFPDPGYMKYAIGTWSRRRLWSWTKLAETMEFVYNPIWNKDGTITETENRTTSGTDSGTSRTGGTTANTGTITDDGDRTQTGTITDDGDRTQTGTISDSGTQDSTIGVDTDRTYKQRGFNDSTLVTNKYDEEHTDTTEDIDTSNTRTLNTAETDDNTRTLNTLETSDHSTTDSRTRSGSDVVSRSRIEQGNIGVTTTQEMIKREREVSMFDIIDTITQEFKKEFCLLVY